MKTLEKLFFLGFIILVGYLSQNAFAMCIDECGLFSKKDLAFGIYNQSSNTLIPMINMSSSYWNIKLYKTLDLNNNKIINLLTPTLPTDAQVSNHFGIIGSLVTGKCSNTQSLTYQSSNDTWICSSAGTGVITSINSDATPAQVFSGTTGNLTITDTGAGTLQWNLGNNVVTTGLQAQTITKSITFNLAILGGDINVGSNALTNSGHKGTLSSTNSGIFLYSNGTLTGTLSGGTLSGSISGTPTLTGNPVTINNLVATLAGNLAMGSNLFSINGHLITPPANTGTMALLNSSLSSMTGNLNSVGGTFTGTCSACAFSGTQTGSATFGGNYTIKFGAGGILVRNPASTFTLKIEGSAQASNQTINLPTIIQTETFAVKPTVNFTSPSNPTTTTSTTGVMSNLFATFTPKVTGRIMVTVCGQMQSGTAGDGAKFDIRYGTSQIAEGSTIGNTMVGVTKGITSSTAAQPESACNSVQVSGLTVNTKIFIQIGKYAVVGGTATFTNFDVSVIEI